MTASVQRYWANKFWCWHGKDKREIMMSVNGTVLYCGKCYRKVIGIHEFDMEKYEHRRPSS